MDTELRNHFLLLLRPIKLLDQEFLYEALDVGREAYFLVQGNLQVWSYENQVIKAPRDSNVYQCSCMLSGYRRLDA